MLQRTGGQFFRILTTVCLISQAGRAALTPLADADIPSTQGSSAATSADLTGSANATGSESMVSENISATRPVTSQIMGSIKLPKSTMTIDFQEADVRDVLHLLAVKSGINIIYGADVAGPITVHLDRVPFDQAFQTVLTLKGLVALSLGPKVIRVVTSTGLTTEQSQAATFTRVFRLNYAGADDIKKPVDAIRTAAGRKGVSTIDVKTNSIIVTDTQEGLKEVEDLIPVLDKKPQQVDIESKVVEVDLTNNLNTGISWQYAGSAGASDQYKFGATTASQGSSAAGPNTRLNENIISANGPGLGGGTGVALNTIQSTGFSFLTSQGTYILAAQIAALLDQNKARVLSTPHIVTTNNEEASINVADQIPYLTTTVSNGVSQQNVQFISAGVKLTVKPTVNADHRITMHVRPEVSNATGGATVNLPPTVNNRNADTTVILRDGETIAIGGLIKESTTKGVSGIPLLMDIPILGYLFKSVSDNKTRTELIVFLTPRITPE